MTNFNVGDWVLIADDPTTRHVQGKLFRVVEIDERGGYGLVDLTESSNHPTSWTSERLLINGRAEYELIIIKAKMMGIPDNLALAEYIHNIEVRLMRVMWGSQ